MQTPLQQNWQEKAEAKVAKTKAKIPLEWILSKADIEDAKKQRQLSGSFIERFLDNEEREVIQNDSVPLLSKIQSGQYTACHVAKAYCKTAAIAHQIVS
jgi:amidase